MNKSIFVGVIIELLVMSLIFVQVVQSVNAFCIFNCAAEDLKNRMQVHADCLQGQIAAGAFGRTSYGTEDLDATGKILTINGVEYTEEELREEWKSNPDAHSSNCYFIGDVTPQEVEKV